MEKLDVLWQDNIIRFDIGNRDLALRTGETLIGKFYPVEDTKGNNGGKGTLKITNLRLIWAAESIQRINLSIGYGCIMNINKKSSQFLSGGTLESLHILAKSLGTRYEFIFTPLTKSNAQLSAILLPVYKAYDSSRLYREMKLRACLLENMKLITLPGEQIYEELDGVWNLTTDQGTLGKLYVSNIRIVWSSSIGNNFNISLPYIHVSSIKIQNSKFGKSLAIRTSKQTGAYLLGFRVDPVDKLPGIQKQLFSLWQLYNKTPFLGVELNHEVEEDPTETPQDDADDDVEDTPGDRGDILASYLAEDPKVTGQRPIYNEELGLAIEPLPEGYNLEDLWLVFPRTKEPKHETALHS